MSEHEQSQRPDTQSQTATTGGASEVDTKASGRQAEASVQALLRGYDVQAVLAQNGCEVLKWIDGIAVLRGTIKSGGLVTSGSSANLYLALEHPRQRGQLRVMLESEESTDEHGGLIVHVIDRRTGRLVLVGIAEGQEENNPVTLAAAKAALAAGVAPHGTSGL